MSFQLCLWLEFSDDFEISEPHLTLFLVAKIIDQVHLGLTLFMGQETWKLGKDFIFYEMVL